MKYPIFSGVGAGIFGGRWNSAGHDVIYTATSLALARLEILANAGGFVEIPRGLGQISIEVPNDTTISRYRGNIVPLHRAESQAFGDKWLAENKHLLLFVPSIASEGDQNVLVNPRHKDFEKIKIGKPQVTVWDKRLFRF